MSQFDDLIDNSRATAAAAKARIQTSYGKAKTATLDVAAKGRDQAGQLGEKVKPVIEKGKAGAAKANNRLKQMAEDQPLTLVAGAVALGALLGSLLPKGRNDPPE